MSSIVYREMTCAAIHDLSGLGKCSLTVALPVLSACGVETSVMPTAVLSTHTGGFEGFTYRDLTEDLLPVARHWQGLGCGFQALYTGFLGSAEQTGLVGEIFDMFPQAMPMVDPVMGDGGRLYRTMTPAMVEGMKGLCARARLVTPNLTEAAALLDEAYQEGPLSRERLEELLCRLCGLGPEMAVLTGVRCEGGLGAVCMEKGGRPTFCMLEELPGAYHGTGDLFASTLLGGLLNGMNLEEACWLAVRFTHQVIESTRKYSKDFRFGPKFEMHLPQLAAEVEAFRQRDAGLDSQSRAKDTPA